MKLLSSATMAPPLLIFHRRRREIILANGQPKIIRETLTTIEAHVSPKVARAARIAGGWLRHRLTLGRIAAGVAVVYFVAVVEDMVGGDHDKANA